MKGIRLTRRGGERALRLSAACGAAFFLLSATACSVGVASKGAVTNLAGEDAWGATARSDMNIHLKRENGLFVGAESELGAGQMAGDWSPRQRTGVRAGYAQFPHLYRRSMVGFEVLGRGGAGSGFDRNSPGFFGYAGVEGGLLLRMDQRRPIARMERVIWPTHFLELGLGLDGVHLGDPDQRALDLSAMIGMRIFTWSSVLP